MAQIDITLNGTALSIAPDTSLEQLLTQHHHGALQGAAVAVNGAIVPRSECPNYTLTAGMAVDVFSLVAGG